tara:strand:+ start:777 stop:923 length:147 start_codon:yes stop_codon:yes gene_type:complete
MKDIKIYFNEWSECELFSRVLVALQARDLEMRVDRDGDDFVIVIVRGE